MRILKFFLVETILLSLLFPIVLLAQISPATHAQLPTQQAETTKEPPPPFLPNSAFRAPATVYVVNIQLENTEYKPGNTVRGTFQLNNMNLTSVQDLYYRITLVGDFDENKLARVAYDQNNFGPLALRGGESKVINFEYTIPEGVAGNLGIHISTFLKSSFILGSAQDFIHVAGILRYAVPKETWITVAKQDFGPETGPSLYLENKDTATYYALLFNSSAEELRLIPNITIYKKEPVSPALKEYTEQEIILKPKETKQISFNLPTFDYEPSVYVGTIRLLTKDGKLGGALLPFKYIVMGETLAIDSVTSDQTSIKKREELQVYVAYSTPPPDMAKNTRQKIGTVTLQVSVFNENNQLVGKGEETFDVDNFSTNKKEFNITALEDGNKLRIEAQIIKGNTILAKTTSELPATLQQIQQTPWQQIKALLPLLLILTILIGILGWFLKTRETNTKLKTIITALLVLILIGIATWLTLKIVKASDIVGGGFWGFGGVQRGFVKMCNQTYTNGQATDPTQPQPLTICNFSAWPSVASFSNPNTTLYWTVQDEYRQGTQQCSPDEKVGTSCTTPITRIPSQCTISGGSYSNTPITSSLGVPVPDEGVTYTLRCFNDQQSTSASTYASVGGTFSGGGSTNGCGQGFCSWLYGNPISPSVLSPGQGYCITGSTQAMFCANGFLNEDYNVYEPLGYHYYHRGTGGSGGHHTQNVGNGFSYCYNAPTQPGVYTVRMDYVAAGSVSGWWDFKVKAIQPSIGSFSAIPGTIPRGGSSTLSWSSTNASYCTISGIGNVGTSGSVPVSPTQDTTYTLTCYNSGGGVSSPVSRTIRVVSIGSFSATPSIITPGGYVSFSWSSSADSCSLSPVGNVPTSVNDYRVYPTQDTTYTLTCSRDDISVSSSPFSVKILRISSFTGGPTTVLSGGNVSFSWSSTNAQSCSLLPLGNVPINTANYTVNPTNDTTYTLTCTNSGISISSSPITIRILSIPIFTISPPEINRGQSATLTWITKNASTCTASSNPNDISWTFTNPPVNSSQQSKTVTPPGKPGFHNYSLTCTGPEGSPSITKSIPAPGLKVHTLLTKIECSKDNITFGDCANIKLVAGSAIYLKDLSDPTPMSPASNAKITNRVWTFSNGSPSRCPSSHAGCMNLQIPKVSFIKEGDQTATLVVTDSAGETETITKTFKISKPSFQETAPQ